MNRIKNVLPLLIFLAAAALLIAGLLPGGISPAGTLKLIADRFVHDGDFEAVTPSFYNRLRPGFLLAGTALLAVAVLLRTGRTRIALGLAGLGAAVLLLAALSLAAGRLNSPVYRALSGTPLAYHPPTSTPVQPLAPTSMPSPTPAPREPGRWEQIVATTGQPTFLVAPSDGSGRLFVGFRTGIIQVVENGQLLNPPFLDLTDRSIQKYESIEQGLLGLALHPDYKQNGYFYVYYIDQEGNTVVSRFQTTAADPNRADPDSEYRLFGVIQPDVAHKGGQLVFGPDGYLYISLGDGGIQRDPFGYAQSLDTYLGKILRIDVDRAEPYSVPPDNPFVGKAGMDEIYAYGMRNPWRFSFDSATGDLYIADVGHNHAEEINYIPAGFPAGFNLGWNYFEGFLPYEWGPGNIPLLPDYVAPAWGYEHGSGGQCAVVGGYVYRGTAVLDLQGTYIYGDYCTGRIWGLSRTASGEWTNELLFDTVFTLTSFATDSENELYLLSLDGGIYKLAP